LLAAYQQVLGPEWVLEGGHDQEDTTAGYLGAPPSAIDDTVVVALRLDALGAKLPREPCDFGFVSTNGARASPPVLTPAQPSRVEGAFTLNRRRRYERSRASGARRAVVGLPPREPRHCSGGPRAKLRVAFRLGV